MWLILKPMKRELIIYKPIRMDLLVTEVLSQFTMAQEGSMSEENRANSKNAS